MIVKILTKRLYNKVEKYDKWQVCQVGQVCQVDQLIIINNKKMQL